MEAARGRVLTQQAELERRRRRAWALARQVADLLRRQYGATRVVVFGSLVHQGRFTRWSDLDIAVWGLSDAVVFRAIAEVFEIDREIPVDLVDAGVCAHALLESIEREGIDV